MRGNADGGLRALFLYFERKKESERSAEGGGGGRDGPNPQRSARAPLRSAARGCEPGALKEGGG